MNLIQRISRSIRDNLPMAEKTVRQCGHIILFANGKAMQDFFQSTSDNLETIHDARRTRFEWLADFVCSTQYMYRSFRLYTILQYLYHDLGHDYSSVTRFPSCMLLPLFCIYIHCSIYETLIERETYSLAKQLKERIDSFYGIFDPETRQVIDERLANKKKAWIEVRNDLIRLLATESEKRAYFTPIAFAKQLDDEPPKYDEIPGGAAKLFKVRFVQSVWSQQVEQVHKDEEQLEELARQRTRREQESNQQYHDLDESEAGSSSNAAASVAHSQEGFLPVPSTFSSNASHASNVSLDAFAPLTDTSSSSESNNSMDDDIPCDQVAVLDELNWVSLT